MSPSPTPAAASAPDAKALIFERLYQDPDSIDNNRTGLGLGLFICKELVKLHGGKIWVASEVGQGSTFTFTLPVYSLAKLLSPVIVQEQQLRDHFVLVKVDLTPLSKTPRGNWRETWQQALETLRRCVYLDKDLVLPPMGGVSRRPNLFRGRLHRRAARRHHDGPHSRPARTQSRTERQRLPGDFRRARGLPRACRRVPRWTSKSRPSPAGSRKSSWPACTGAGQRRQRPCHFPFHPASSICSPRRIPNAQTENPDCRR